VGGVNPVVQLAAALDRRGVTVSVDGDRVRVHLGGFTYIVIKPLTEGVAPHEYGREWCWQYGGGAGRHPVGDYEGAAEAIVKFLRGVPALAGSALIYRMDHMGMSWAEETQEALDRARAKQEAGGEPGRAPGR
jgi:hypothetical protein